MRKIVWFAIKSFVFLCLGAYAAASYMTPAALSESPEPPWRSQVVFDFSKTDGHFNIGIGWRKVGEPRADHNIKDQF